MPKVKVAGKVKHFPYSKKGKEAAKEAIKKTGSKVKHWSQGLKSKKK